MGGALKRCIESPVVNILFLKCCLLFQLCCCFFPLMMFSIFLFWFWQVNEQCPHFQSQSESRVGSKSRMKAVLLNKIKGYEQLVFCSYFLFDWFCGRKCVWQWVRFINPSHSDQPVPLHLSAQKLLVRLIVHFTALPNSSGFMNYHIYTKVTKELLDFSYVSVPCLVVCSKQTKCSISAWWWKKESHFPKILNNIC